MRLDNNAQKGETTGAFTRTLSSSNVESVEIVTGIPSVEYGDLSNGIVKVRTRRGKSPFVVEGSLNQHTRQIAVSKGFAVNSGALNVSMEHARSFSDAASPHTAYQRNVLSLHYSNTFFRQSMSLTLNVGLTGNIGGYNSVADPDEELDDYSKARDNALRSNIDLQWLLNKPWLTNLQFSASFSYQDRKQESYTHTSSASTQPYIHATEEGYNMAQTLNPEASSLTPDIVLGPTGYWYVRSYADSKPLSWAARLKADCNRRFGNVANRFAVGTQYQASRNNGRGTYSSRAQYNPSLRWQDTRQWDLGVEFTIKGTRVSLSAFHHKTCGSYMAENTYTPFSYRYTAPSAAQDQ